MPASQGRVCKLIFANIFKPLPHFSQPFPCNRSTIPLLVLRRFSSLDGSSSSTRPMRGQEVTERESDDLFVRRTEPGGFIDDDGDNNYSKGDGRRTYKSDQNPPNPIPNRPLRGDKRIYNQSEHPSQNNQPIFRGRRQPSNDLFPNKFNDDGFSGGIKMEDGADKKMNKSFQSSPLQFLNKSLAGEKGDDQLEDSFLDKFKLGVKKKDNPHQTATTQVPKQEDTNDRTPMSETLPQDADEIFKKMKETGLIPNAVAMLDGLCKDGLVQEAMKLFSLMREKGTIPEVVIYTAVVEGFCKAQKLDDAKRIFRKMQNNGISPNAFSYTILIQGLYKCNKLEDAVDFCVEMLEAGHSPNVATLAGLVDALCREKGVEEAQNVIGRLREKGFFVDEKAVREYLDKKAPFSPLVWEAILGKKSSQKSF